MKDKHSLHFESAQVHSGQRRDATGSVVTPIYQTSTFAFERAEDSGDCFAGKGYVYTRLSNPTIEDLEEAMATLEQGTHALATSTGMSALNTLFFTLLKKGDHVIVQRGMYAPTLHLLERYRSQWGLVIDLVDMCDIEEVKAHLRSNTRLVVVETPSNPMLQLVDLEAVCAVCRMHGAYVAVDNTFCSPYLQQPIRWGVDFVVHSMTKFINGHSDVVAGVVVLREDRWYEEMKKSRSLLGNSMDPHQAFLVRRGLRTLSLRVERAQENAMTIARYLDQHPKVARVWYPGLPSHPQYALAKKQMKGPGAMVTFELKGGYDAAIRLLNTVKLASLAVSLGGVETLIEHPWSMTHRFMSEEEKKSMGLTPGVIRYAAGIEHAEDLQADLEQALEGL